MGFIKITVFLLAALYTDVSRADVSCGKSDIAFCKAEAFLSSETYESCTFSSTRICHFKIKVLPKCSESEIKDCDQRCLKEGKYGFCYNECACTDKIPGFLNGKCDNNTCKQDCAVGAEDKCNTFSGHCISEEIGTCRCGSQIKTCEQYCKNECPVSKGDLRTTGMKKCENEHCFCNGVYDTWLACDGEASCRTICEKNELLSLLRLSVVNSTCEEESCTCYFTQESTCKNGYYENKK